MSAAQAAAWSPRAAATTVAPCSANRWAIARPIPRDAPVTSATLPDKSNMKQRFDGCEIVWRAERERRRLAVYLAHQPAQHRPGTHFNICCDALRGKALDDGFPAHR